MRAGGVYLGVGAREVLLGSYQDSAATLLLHATGFPPKAVQFAAETINPMEVLAEPAGFGSIIMTQLG